MRAELLTIGDELLDGIVVDTNAAWLGGFLMDRGIQVVRTTTVRDDIDEISEALKTISTRSELCICTGGLGPTSDDLTIEALCDALGAELLFQDDVWQRIVHRYAPRIPPESNRKQAMIPSGAWALASEVGTAPGVRAQMGACSVFLFPGVPRELRWHAQRYLAPYLTQIQGIELAKRTVRFIGLGESDLAERVTAMGLHKDVVVGYRTALPENHVRLRGSDGQLVHQAARQLADGLSKYFVGFDDIGIAQAIINLCEKAGCTLATAESCTGGLAAASLTAIPGASAVYLGSVVSYSNRVKETQLGVPEEFLQEEGAVSERCALAMATGVRDRLGTDIGVGITGIAGPGGGTPDKPVGTVCFGWVGPGFSKTRRVCFRGDRDRVRALAVGYALDGIRREYVR